MHRTVLSTESLPTASEFSASAFSTLFSVACASLSPAVSALSHHSPQALLRGFITAVGLVIFIGQAIPILGLEQVLAATSPPPITMVDKIAFLVQNLRNTQLLTLAVSLGALAVLIGAKMFKGRLMSRRGFGWLAYVPE